MKPSCLWIARDLPFPLDSGDKIYTSRISEALAEAGVTVTLIAHDSGPLGQPPQGWPVATVTVHGGKRPTWRALLSAQPLASAVHPTRQFRTQLAGLLERQWDLIVVDQLGSAWALERCLAYRRRHPACRLMYLSHNHETTLWRGMADRSSTTWPKRLALQQNAWKTRVLERELVEHMDLVTTVTAEDAALYNADFPAVRTMVLTPGYAGRTCVNRSITSDMPRRVVLMGSFRWAVKQENLRQFLAEADRRFSEAGIVLDVVGDVPAALRESLEPGLQATTLHGFVDDVSAIMDRARIAVVPEVIGGGFKLKFLDYIFMRLPIATIREAAAGLPDALRQQMIQADNMPSLVDAIIAGLDDTVRLDGMQNRAYELAGDLYRWQDRGRALQRWLIGSNTNPDQDLRIEAAGVQV